MTPPAPAPAPLGDDERAAAKTMLAATWRSWGLCVLAPSAWLAYAVWRLPMSGAGLQNGDSGVVGAVSGPGWGWLVGLAVVWLALAGPAVFALRSYCFRALWDGRAVEPQSYLKGMGTVWAVLVVGAVLALMGAVLSGQWLPGVVVAGVAVGLVLVIRPNGRALGLG